MQEEVKSKIRCKIREHRKDDRLPLTDLAVNNLTEDIAEIVDQSVSDALADAMEFREILDALGLKITGLHGKG